MSVTTTTDKKAMNLNESKEMYMWEFGGRKEKEKFISFYYNIKNKRKSATGKD